MQGEMKRRHQSCIELLQGTLNLLIPQTLRWGPCHGYGTSRAIRANSGEILQADSGSLYPALHRLKGQKWIRADWKLPENNQRGKPYRLTRTGKKQRASERSRGEQLQEAMGGILNRAVKESVT
jgi:PadR family transcriptional regulator, regulatory protein PadR